jgi:hypothetical protein
MDPTIIRKKSVSTIEEYLGINQVDEVKACMSEMCSGFGSIFAEEMFNALINKKDKDRVMLEQLMVEVVGVKGGISVQEWSDGLINVMEFIEDIKIDVPKCDEWLGKMCGCLLSNSIIPMRAIESILKKLKDDVLAMFTWGILQNFGEAKGDTNIVSTYRRCFAWLSSNRDKDIPGRYISALAQVCPAKGIKIGAQVLLGKEINDVLEARASDTEHADLGYCVGASWAAAHQRFREPKPEGVDMSVMPQRSSQAYEQFIKAVYDVAILDRWKDSLRDERLDALVAAGFITKDTLEFFREFNNKK